MYHWIKLTNPCHALFETDYRDEANFELFFFTMYNQESIMFYSRR